MFNRREFLKYAGLLLGAASLPRWSSNYLIQGLGLSDSKSLGRICSGEEGARTEIKSEPNMNAPTIGTAWRDEVIEWKREVIANQLDYYRFNQKWVETTNGYIYSPYVQPVKNIINDPLTELPINSDGKKGLWVEVTVPIVDVIPDNAPSSYWIREALKPRIYYSQVFWAYEIQMQNGQVQYKLTEKYGAEPDSYWVDATTCRPITADELAPIHPDVTDKHILVDLNYQTLSCLEGRNEVYFCEISSGGIVEGKWLTPVGTHTIWRKMVSTHMSAGGLWGFDAPGIAWTTLFDNNGAAIHSAYWHNNFGTALSHGCLNCRPEDAKWIWRWTRPQVDIYPGELTIQGGGQSTLVEIKV